MAWFERKYQFEQSSLRLAHITDCHLFADTKGEYFGVNTAHYFSQVLAALSEAQLDAVIFGGDLTQDHTPQSYSVFASLIAESNLSCPVFWVPGNHDDLTELERISEGQISAVKYLSTSHLDILLLNSKGPTPAGWCADMHLNELEHTLGQSNNPSLVFCHHHPVPIQGYLDKHMLENGPQLLNRLLDIDSVVALVHGHVHNDYHMAFRGLDIFATPATSIQFAKQTNAWQQHDLGPAWRLIEVENDKITTEVIWLNE